MESVRLSDLPELTADALAGPERPVALAGPYALDLDSITCGAVQQVLASMTSPLLPVVIGHASAPVPDPAADLLVHLTCTYAPGAPGSAWVRTVDPGPLLSRIDEAVRRTPVAAAALTRLLQTGGGLDTGSALELESATYSALLGSPEFRRWRAAHPARPAAVPRSPVRVERHGSTLCVTLDHPQRRNAFSAAMRDALAEALRIAVIDGELSVELRGAGSSFCSGGDLDEFGTTSSIAEAHLLRLEQHCGWLVHRLRDRAVPVLHGACVGAGLEVPAFADRVLGVAGAWFQLPELGMGLVPGAGGTVSVPARIGRWRTAHMVLTGDRVDLDTALEWGLVDDRA